MKHWLVVGFERGGIGRMMGAISLFARSVITVRLFDR
jgi:hypothetical protein